MVRTPPLNADRLAPLFLNAPSQSAGLVDPMPLIESIGGPFPIRRLA